MIYRNNLNILISVKEYDSLMIQENQLKIDDRLMKNMRYTESIKDIVHIIKVSFYHYINLISLPDIKFNENSIILNELTNDEFKLNIVTLLEQSLEGLNRLIVYYREYQIKDYPLLEKLIIDILRDITAIKEIYNLSTNINTKKNDIEVINENDIESYESYRINNYVNDNVITNMNNNNLDDNNLDDNMNNDDLNDNSLDDTSRDNNNITTEKEHIEEDDHIELVHGGESADNHNGNLDIIIEEPKLTDTFELTVVNPTFKDSYFNPDALRNNINNEKEEEDKSNNKYFTIPVFCSINTFFKGMKNKILNAYNYLKSKINSWCKKNQE